MRGPSASVAGGTRRLSAVMLTDMVGYSSVTQRDEALALRLLREQERLVRSLLASHRGREVKTIGDGFLVEFRSALDAVRCAIEIQRGLVQRNTGSVGEHIELRIGIHLGDVVHRGGDLFGDSVNIVSRLEPLAEPGGICVSQQVYDQIQNKVEEKIVRLGNPELKHIGISIGVYKIDLAGPKKRPVSAGEDQRRIAVLPLVNISADPNDEYFADGITEELILTLSRITGFRVIARTSVMRYKHTDKSIAEIGRELGVQALVEGGVRKAGTKLRISAQLIDARKEVPLWSQAYDRNVRDVFAIQRDIAQNIADALRVEILRTEEQRLGTRPTADPEAHSLYLHGRFFWNKRTAESLAKSIDYFGQALTKDRNFALAYTGVADANATLALLEFVRPRAAFPKAKVASQKALQLDDTLAEAHTSLGLVRFLYDRDWAGAEAEFRRALSLNSNYPPAHHFYADYLKAMGRLDEALTEIRRAQELDPLSLAINTGVGHVLYLSRQYDQAIEQYRKTLELDPSFVQTHLWFGRPYLEKGMYAAAIAELQRAVQLSGESTMSLAVLGHAYASAGRGDEARAILERLEERAGQQYVPSYWIALIHIGLDDRDRAFAWLERAYRERSSWLAWIKVEPRFDRLRSDPRFAALIRKLKLT